MLIAGVTLVALLLLAVCASSDRERLDQDEIRDIRRLADRLRQEEYHPFE